MKGWEGNIGCDEGPKIQQGSLLLYLHMELRFEPLLHGYRQIKDPEVQHPER